MKHSLITLFTLLLSVSISVQGSVVSPETAYTEALQFYKKLHPTKTRTGRALHAEPQLLYATDGTMTGFYVFNTMADEGFIVVSADDRTAPILGYTRSGNFNAKHVPDALQFLLDIYAQEMRHLTDAAQPEAEATRAAVEPLLTTQWGQASPYNAQTPLAEYDGPTGCVATALAQVLNYYRCPAGEMTEAIPAYAQYEGLEPTSFDWDLMQSFYNPEDLGDAAADEVAKLMKYCGYAVRMNYGYYGSAASNITAVTAMTKYFGFDNTVQYLRRQNYNAQEWTDLVYNELAAGRLVFYGGSSCSTTGIVGHAFLCDGYDGDGLFHINWGWNGMSDGYFRLSVLKPVDEGIGGNNYSGGYSLDQAIIIGMKPLQGAFSRSAALTAVNLAPQNEVVTRSSLNQGFDPQYFDVSLTNNMPETYKFDFTLGLYRDGELLETYDGQNGYNIDPQATLRGTFPLRFAPNIADGSYRLCLMNRLNGERTWKPCEDSERTHVNITVNGLTMTLRASNPSAANSIVDYVVNDVDVSTRHRVGSPMSVTLSVTNNGNVNYSPFYLYQKTESGVYRMGGVGSFIEPGKTGTVTFQFSPFAEGNQTFFVTNSESASGALKEFDVDIAPISTTPVQLSFATQAENATASGNIAGSKLTLHVFATNRGTEEYGNYLLATLYRETPAGSGTYYSESSLERDVTILANETGEVVFEFNNLNIDSSYFVALQYLQGLENGRNNTVTADRIFFRTVPEGIQGVQQHSKAASTIFNMQGQRLNAPAEQLPRGIYIVGGKKTLVK